MVAPAVGPQEGRPGGKNPTRVGQPLPPTNGLVNPLGRSQGLTHP
nr:hypothetical protein [Prochlorothrix hollandica]